MASSRAVGALCWTAAVALACSQAPRVTASPPRECARLLELPIADGGITSASIVAAEKGLPGFCDVFGTTQGTIGFEVRLPTDGWNGKMYFGGNGGFAGHVRKDMSHGLSRRYATVSTDTGHRVLDLELDVLDASWALDNPRAELDYAHRGVHAAAVVGKEVIRAYYGVVPTRSYFEGCSNGGRQGLQEAIRYPEDFDGIVSRDPVLDFTGTFIAHAWNLRAQRSAAITVETLGVLGDAVLATCDANDGLRDGLIDDPRACRFQPSSLRCRSPEQGRCLSAGEVLALEKIYGGPRDSRGRQLFPGLSLGGERPDSSDRGWDAWVLHRPDSPSRSYVLARQFFRYLAFHPDRPGFAVEAFDFDADPPQMTEAGRELDATSVELAGFRDRGGKLLLLHGWSDPSVPPLRTVAYFEALRSRFGRETADFARLFMIPGAHHCGGGPGPGEVDALGALERWVEAGQPPGSIVAAHRSDADGGVDRTRPLCPYPSVARHRGSGSVDEAASFACVDPPPVSPR